MRAPRLRVSIRAKLALPVAAAVMVLALSGAFLVRDSLERSLEEELDRRALALASELALRATHESLFEDVVGLDRLVTDMMTRDDVRYVVVIGSSGYVLTSSFAAGVPTDLVAIFETPREDIRSPVAFRTAEGVNADYVAQMIGGQLGTVHLGVTRTRIHDQARERGRMVLGLGAMAALGAALLSFVIAHLATDPLRRLADAASRVGTGDLSVRSGVDSDDEVGDLAVRFDEMIERLRDNQSRLELAHRQMVRTERLAVAGQVASGVAHEIGNPLHAARQFAEALKDNPNAQERYLPLVDEALGRIDKVISQMLGFSSERTLDPRPTDVNEVVRSALDFVRYDPRSREVRLESDRVAGGAMAFVDPDVLNQVLINLMVNALDAVGRDGRIRVSTATQGGEGDESFVVVAVSDDGPGIPAELRERIFEPFYTTKEVGEGTGLGLSVSQELLEVQRGRLALRSGAGEGATFEVWLPTREVV